MKPSKLIGLLLGIALLLTPLFVGVGELSFAGRATLGIFAMAAVFWISEPIPIFATSMLVILLQVLLLSDASPLATTLVAGSDEPQAYSDFYAKLASPIIVLFLGGFALAAAAVKFNLDKNITRVLLRPFGKHPAMVCLGLMVVTGVLSAFMSNTATTAMMVTVVLPIVSQLDAKDPFRKVVALAIPVSANIGGVATPIGTPPNAIALGALAKQGIIIPFSTWMLLAVPLVVVLLLLSWWALMWLFPPQCKEYEVTLSGKFDTSPKAITAYLVFAATVLLWVTEKLHGIPSAVVAFLPLALMPALGVLDKKDIRGFAWDVLWLVAGGISLGMSLKNTGLAAWFVELVDWGSLGGVGLMVAFCLVGFGMATLVSRTVSAAILAPLAVGLASAGGESVSLAVMVVVTCVIVSFSMMLPISTPPNAIAMSTGMIETRDLAKIGAVVGVLGFFGTIAFGLLYWPLIIG